MPARLRRFLLGLVLLPPLLATLYHLPDALLPLGSDPTAALILLGGMLAYVLTELAFSRPMRTYVFGHELTHALAALATGGKVLSFNVSKKGGSVSLSKSNFIVALAPYCVPIYTVLVTVLAFAVRGADPSLPVREPFLAAVGFTLAFHASLTLFAIRQEQPDIKKTGSFFSLVFIAFSNLWVLALISKAVFRDSVDLGGFFGDAVKTQWLIFKWSGGKLLEGASWAWRAAWDAAGRGA